MAKLLIANESLQKFDPKTKKDLEENFCQEQHRKRDLKLKKKTNMIRKLLDTGGSREDIEVNLNSIPDAEDTSNMAPHDDEVHSPTKTYPYTIQPDEDDNTLLEDATVKSSTLSTSIVIPLSAEEEHQLHAIGVNQRQRIATICLMQYAQNHLQPLTQKLLLHVDGGTNRSLKNYKNILLHFKNIKAYYMSSASMYGYWLPAMEGTHRWYNSDQVFLQPHGSRHNYITHWYCFEPHYWISLLDTPCWYVNRTGPCSFHK